MPHDEITYHVGVVESSGVPGVRHTKIRPPFRFLRPFSFYGMSRIFFRLKDLYLPICEGESVYPSERFGFIKKIEILIYLIRSYVSQVGVK